MRVEGELLEFQSFNLHKEEEATEFGLLGKIEARIEETNASTRAKLQRILNGMDSEAGQ